MMLNNSQIRYEVNEGRIKSPDGVYNIGANSLDVRLAKTLWVYDEICPFNMNHEPKGHYIELGGSFLMAPGKLVLGVTMEWTMCPFHVPMFHGCSSLGRLGLSVHQTAGFGDVGFVGHWTLELSCLHPIELEPGMRIGQIAFFEIREDGNRYKGRYANPFDKNPKPVPYKLSEALCLKS